jgi:pyruvate formate lyase activating enzyme
MPFLSVNFIIAQEECKISMIMKEALLYQKLSNKSVQCNLCSHLCKIPLGKSGICRVRKNINGNLYSLIYGKLIAQHCDPVEKKPLYHFYPGTKALSIGTLGCNFHCSFCQNCDISQITDKQIAAFGKSYQPNEIVDLAIQKGCKSIAYTYNEPTIFFEYAYDVARIANQRGLKNIWVSNGYMTEKMLDWMLPWIDAFNIDLKAFQEKTYHQVTGGHLKPVLDSLIKIAKSGKWLEVTTLIIPGINDSSFELSKIAHFIINQLGADVPWHISRFFPAYKMNHIPPTPLKTLMTAYNIGINEGLHYVYIGNIPQNEHQNTRCPKCHNLLIVRSGYHLYSYNIKNGECPYCQNPLPIIAD